MTQYDAIIIGGGHNGCRLPCKSREKVLVLERRHVPGGAAVTREYQALNTPSVPKKVSLHAQKCCAS
jgi:phytoene dehydrogenase-like protein